MGTESNENESKPEVWGRIVHDGTEDGGETVVENPTWRGSREVQVREKERRAIALKLAGASYQSIAQQLGYASATGAWKAVQRGMKKSLQEGAGELRRIHYGRLEHMLMLLWPDVNRKDLPSMHTALSIMDRMERLFGLNAAERIEVSSGRETVIVADGGKDDYIKALQEAGQRLAGVVNDPGDEDDEDDEYVA